MELVQAETLHEWDKTLIDLEDVFVLIAPQNALTPHTTNVTGKMTSLRRWTLYSIQLI